MGLDPVSLGTMATIATMAGAGISAYSTYQEGKAQKDMAKYNAKAARQEAEAESAVAGQNAMRQREMNRRQIAGIRSRIASNGVALSSGSSLDAIGQTASELELSVLDAFRESKLKQTSLYNQAALQRWQGNQAMSAAKIGAIGSLVGGVAKASSQWTDVRAYSGRSGAYSANA